MKQPHTKKSNLMQTNTSIAFACRYILYYSFIKSTDINNSTMADHLEEQELEAEALAAIFDTVFEIISTSATDEVSNHWKISLYPIDTFDEDESLEVNHIGCNLIVKLTQNYPEELPNLEIDIIRGLGPEQKETLESIAMEEAEQFLGMPAIYSVCEKIREWLVDNNVKGLDDQSMHAQMLRKAREQEMKKVCQNMVNIMQCFWMANFLSKSM